MFRKKISSSLLEAIQRWGNRGKGAWFLQPLLEKKEIQSIFVTEDMEIKLIKPPLRIGDRGASLEGKLVITNRSEIDDEIRRQRGEDVKQESGTPLKPIELKPGLEFKNMHGKAVQIPLGAKNIRLTNLVIHGRYEGSSAILGAAAIPFDSSGGLTPHEVSLRQIEDKDLFRFGGGGRIAGNLKLLTYEHEGRLVAHQVYGKALVNSTLNIDPVEGKPNLQFISGGQLTVDYSEPIITRHPDGSTDVSVFTGITGQADVAKQILLDSVLKLTGGKFPTSVIGLEPELVEQKDSAPHVAKGKSLRHPHPEKSSFIASWMAKLIHGLQTNYTPMPFAAVGITLSYRPDGELKQTSVLGTAKLWPTLDLSIATVDSEEKQIDSVHTVIKADAPRSLFPSMAVATQLTRSRLGMISVTSSPDGEVKEAKNDPLIKMLLKFLKHSQCAEYHKFLRDLKPDDLQSNLRPYFYGKNPEKVMAHLMEKGSPRECYTFALSAANFTARMALVSMYLYLSQAEKEGYSAEEIKKVQDAHDIVWDELWGTDGAFIKDPRSVGPTLEKVKDILDIVFSKIPEGAEYQELFNREMALVKAMAHKEVVIHGYEEANPEPTGLLDQPGYGHH